MQVNEQLKQGKHVTCWNITQEMYGRQSTELEGIRNQYECLEILRKK